MHDLNRFVKAQEFVYHHSLNEIKSGQKIGHWMWFIFPQVIGLGYSGTAQYYAIHSREEAEAYLSHPILGKRLFDMVSVLLLLPITNPEEIFGDTDALKLKSCMTLFATVASKPCFQLVLDKFYSGEECQFTKNFLSNH